MSTQRARNGMNKRGVKVNPSRDLDHGDKKKVFSHKEKDDETHENTGEEINPSELDHSEVELDRGGVEFSGGEGNVSKNKTS